MELKFAEKSNICKEDLVKKVLAMRGYATSSCELHVNNVLNISIN